MVCATDQAIAVTGDTMLPDLLRQKPQARHVLDRHGLRGCGGQAGPMESISFFAKMHGLDEEALLREIQHDTTGINATEYAAPRLADALYRPYFIAGIIMVLTAGATWGAWLLWRIGFDGAFTGISIHEVNAHGHAQIFGWVGLFVMGFAYQALPRMWHVELAGERFAVVALACMLLGLVTRTSGMTLHASWSLALPAAMVGAAMQIAAIAIFVIQMAVTWRASRVPVEPYIGFIFAGLTWFFAQSLFSAWHTWQTMVAADRAALLWQVATYQAPLRDLQIHGFALFMILGVNLRMLPALFGLPSIPHRHAWTAFGVLIFAVIGEIALFIAYRTTGMYALAGALLLPWLMLALGVWMIARVWRPWRSFPTSDRSSKFVRAAYAWLAVSLVMLLALPLYLKASALPFSHAYYGAIRHAITVGFVSMMIMGFAAKIVPTLNGCDPRYLPRLWGPFVLINVGCFLRVATQTLTDWHPGLFPFIGISGTLEVIALAWWGLGVIHVMRDKRAAQHDATSHDKPERIIATHYVGDVLAWFPQTEQIFVAHGFKALRNPLLRRTVAKVTTVEHAAAMRGLPLSALLDALNQQAASSTASQAVSLTYQGRPIGAAATTRA